MFGTRLNVNIRDENGNRERAGNFVRDAMRTSPYLQTCERTSPCRWGWTCEGGTWPAQ